MLLSPACQPSAKCRSCKWTAALGLMFHASLTAQCKRLQLSAALRCPPPIAVDALRQVPCRSCPPRWEPSRQPRTLLPRAMPINICRSEDEACKRQRQEGLSELGQKPRPAPPPIRLQRGVRARHVWALTRRHEQSGKQRRGRPAKRHGRRRRTKQRSANAGDPGNPRPLSGQGDKSHGRSVR